MLNPDKAYKVVLVSSHHDGRRSVKIKFATDSSLTAHDFLNDLIKRCPKTGNVGPDYRVLNRIDFAELNAVICRETAARRAKGAKKAAATRKKHGAAAFVLCPRCGAKSKKLWSEMGGLETRQCKNHHRFEHDRWLADRAFWAPVLTGRVIPESSITKEVES